MKNSFVILCIALLSASFAAAESAPATNDESVGTITEFAPGATLVLKTDAGDTIVYALGKQVVFQNANGKEIPIYKLKRGRKVRVHYLKSGSALSADRVTLVQE